MSEDSSVLNVVFSKLVPNPICVPNLKLLASTVAEINRGSQIVPDAPLVHAPANFGLKRCFLVRKSQTEVLYQI